MADLIAKKEKFAQLVAAGNTYTESYREAYPTSKKWKETSVWCESSKLMANTMVLQRVKQIQQEAANLHEVTLTEVLKELSGWLRFNVKTIFNEDGTMKQLHEMEDAESACIASYEVVEIANKGILKKVKLIDKQAVADKLLKFFGAYIADKTNPEDLGYLEDMLMRIKE